MKGELKKHKGKIIAALVIVVIAITVVITINVTGSKKKSSEKTVRESTIQLSKMNLTKSVSATGTMESAKTKNISADVNGVKVAKVNVKVGDTVKKGDTLVTFDLSDNQDTLDDANDNLTSGAKNSSSGSNYSCNIILDDYWNILRILSGKQGSKIKSYRCFEIRINSNKKTRKVFLHLVWKTFLVYNISKGVNG